MWHKLKETLGTHPLIILGGFWFAAFFLGYKTYEYGELRILEKTTVKVARLAELERLEEAARAKIKTREEQQQNEDQLRNGFVKEMASVQLKFAKESAERAAVAEATINALKESNSRSLAQLAEKESEIEKFAHVVELLRTSQREKVTELLKKNDPTTVNLRSAGALVGKWKRPPTVWNAVTEFVFSENGSCEFSNVSSTLFGNKEVRVTTSAIFSLKEPGTLRVYVPKSMTELIFTYKIENNVLSLDLTSSNPLTAWGSLVVVQFTRQE